jgi:hypothetical protein
MDTAMLKFAVSLALGALLILMGMPIQAASFQVSPTRFEFPLTENFTNFFTVTNQSEKPLRVRVYPKFVHFDENGTMVESVESPYDMSPWIVISPRFVSLGPLDRRVVRFSVRLPDKPLAPGEYRAVMFFEELPSPPDPAQQESRTGATIRLDLLTRLGASLYGNVGKPEARVELEPKGGELKDKRWIYTAALINRGDARALLKVEAALIGPDNQAIRTFTEAVVVQRNQQRVLRLDWPAPVPGQYTVTLSATGEGLPPLRIRQPVTIATPPERK